MEKCSNHFPDFKLLEFKENPLRKNIFDLQTTSATFEKFKYFRLETPKQFYLIKQGAKYVCESWINGTKILHTGLIYLGESFYYVGDFCETYKNKKKTSLMIFKFCPDTSTIQIYFFNHFNKLSVGMKYKFCRDFINNIIKKGTVTIPPPLCSNHNLTNVRNDIAKVVNI